MCKNKQVQYKLIKNAESTGLFYYMKHIIYEWYNIKGYFFFFYTKNK